MNGHITFIQLLSNGHYLCICVCSKYIYLKQGSTYLGILYLECAAARVYISTIEGGFGPLCTLD